MPPSTIAVIRHAEKPDKHAAGVAHDGSHDEHSLSVRGWTRAGALAALFSYAPTSAHDGLVQPGRVLATSPAHGAESHREIDTATPIAQRLGVQVESHFTHADNKKLAESLLASDVDALVVWHHGTIPDLLAHLPISASTPVPTQWPEDRFDLIWLLTRDGASYRFTQIAQGLLAGDSTSARG